MAIVPLTVKITGKCLKGQHSVSPSANSNLKAATRTHRPEKKSGGSAFPGKHGHVSHIEALFLRCECVTESEVLWICLCCGLTTGSSYIPFPSSPQTSCAFFFHMTAAFCLLSVLLASAVFFFPLSLCGPSFLFMGFIIFSFPYFSSPFPPKNVSTIFIFPFLFGRPLPSIVLPLE